MGSALNELHLQLNKYLLMVLVKIYVTVVCRQYNMLRRFDVLFSPLFMFKLEWTSMITMTARKSSWKFKSWLEVSENTSKLRQCLYFVFKWSWTFAGLWMWCTHYFTQNIKCKVCAQKDESFQTTLLEFQKNKKIDTLSNLTLGLHLFNEVKPISTILKQQFEKITFHCVIFFQTKYAAIHSAVLGLN